MDDSVVEPVLDPGQFAVRRLAANVQPRVLHQSQPVLHLGESSDAALLVTGRDCSSRREETAGGLIPWVIEAAVKNTGAIGQVHRLMELPMMRHDVGEVVGAAC